MDECSAADERSHGPDHRHADGDVEGDDRAPQAHDREAAHDEPADAVGPSEDLFAHRPADGPGDEKAEVYGRVGERGPLEMSERHLSISPTRRSGSSASSGHSAGSAGHQA